MIESADQIAGLVDEAQRASVSVHPVNPAGPVIFARSLADRRSTTRGTTGIRDADAMGPTRLLERVADETGGQAILDTAAVRAGLDRLRQSLASYYVVGYYSTNRRFDGRYRKIEVRCRRAGVSVIARRGYVAPTDAMFRATLAAAATADHVTATTRTLLGPPEILRGGPGEAWAQAADATFRRVDRLRVVWPIVAGPVDRRSARLLGGDGRPLAVPVATTEIVVGSRPAVAADLTLAPLAPGRYAIELVVGAASDVERVVVPFTTTR
jgi:hypothetical protein